MTTYAMNLDTAASSRYEGFDFNSFFRGSDGKYYGLADDGVYLLEGDPANDVVEASVFFGRFDFGTQQLKLLPAVYAGVAAQAPVALRVGTPDGKWTYNVRTYTSALEQQRFDTGRGMRGNWFTFELYNVTGGDFALAELSMLPAVSTRRI